LFDHVEEYLGFKGLSEMHRHTRLVPFGFVIRCKTTRQEDNRHVAAPCTLTNSLAQLEAIHVWHGGISQHNIGPQRLRFVQAIQGITRHHDLKVLVGKGSLNDGLNGQTVFNEQQFRGHTEPFSCRSTVHTGEQQSPAVSTPCILRRQIENASV
jgi:hypothetical protein